ncbi:MAG: hypothetical protein ACREQ9_04990 [Candidatus Binatia bacterium]
MAPRVARGDRLLRPARHVDRLFDVEGWSLAVEGEPSRGLETLGRGLARYRGCGVELGLTRFLADLAETAMLAGRSAEALAAAEDGLALAARTGEGAHVAELHRLRGEILLRGGDDGREAEACFRRALALASRQRARSLALRAALALARLRGCTRSTRRVLDDVCREFRDGSATRELREARALLDSPVRGP